MRYAEQRIPTLNDYCVICDEKHVFQNGPMLKVSLCKRQAALKQMNKNSLIWIASLPFAPGNCASFPFTRWERCQAPPRRWPPAQRSITHPVVVFTSIWDDPFSKGSLLHRWSTCWWQCVGQLCSRHVKASYLNRTHLSLIQRTPKCWPLVQRYHQNSADIDGLIWGFSDFRLRFFCLFHHRERALKGWKKLWTVSCWLGAWRRSIRHPCH